MSEEVYRLWWVDYQSQRSIKLECAPDYLKIGVSAKTKLEALTNAEDKLKQLNINPSDWKYVGGSINPPTPSEYLNNRG